GLLGSVLLDVGVTGTIGADSDGYPGILGYAGPSLTEVTASRVVPIAPFLERSMTHKSDEEVALIRESGRWCSHAHTLLQQHSVPGTTETEASLRATCEATLAMLAELGPSYGGQYASSAGASAGYRRLIGHRSSWAHAP